MSLTIYSSLLVSWNSALHHKLMPLLLGNYCLLVIYYGPNVDRKEMNILIFNISETIS